MERERNVQIIVANDKISVLWLKVPMYLVYFQIRYEDGNLKDKVLCYRNVNKYVNYLLSSFKHTR